MYSIPIRHPNSSFHTTILPEHTYLATDTSGQYYAATSSVDNCIIYAPRKRVCKDIVIYDSSVRPICEVDILLSKTTSIPSTCTTTTFPAEINTFQPIGPSNWLYILNNETNCVLQCSVEISNLKLQGSGIITLPQGCKLHTGYSTLSAFQTSEENITIPIIVPDVRSEDCFETFKNEESQKLIPITINDMPLDSLRSIKVHLEKYAGELQNLKASKAQSFLEKNQTSFSWIYLSIGMIMLIYISIKLCNRCPNGFIRRNNSRTCIQVFNNCFDHSSRRRNVHVAIPMSNLHHPTTCISDDEDDIEDQQPSSSPQPQKSGANAQSLF